ncbi:MAG: hypothetical protein ACRCUY_06915 [Thermoguttaceae bacterium]
MKYLYSFILVSLLLGCQSAPTWRTGFDTKTAPDDNTPGLFARTKAFFAPTPFYEERIAENKREIDEQGAKQNSKKFASAIPDASLTASNSVVAATKSESETNTNEINNEVASTNKSKTTDKSNKSVQLDESGEIAANAGQAANSSKSEEFETLAELLKPKRGESERFRKFLEMIINSAESDRGVDEETLKRLITNFRKSEIDWAEFPDLESQTIWTLRAKILPNYSPNSNNATTSENIIPGNETELLTDNNKSWEKTSNKKIDAKLESKSQSKSNTSANLSENASKSRSASIRQTTSQRFSDDDLWNDEELEEPMQLTMRNRASLPPAALSQQNRRSAPNPLRAPMPSEQTETPSFAFAASNIASSPSLLLNQAPIYPVMGSPNQPVPNQSVPNQSASIQANQGTALTANQTANYPVNQGATHGIIQASYQNQVGLPIHTTNYAPGSPLAATDWETQTRIATDLLRNRIEQTVDGRTFANEMRLRLLELALGNRSEAVRPMRQTEEPINEFWSNQVLGITALMDEPGQPNKSIRYVNAAFRFDEGLMELRRLCPIKLKNVQIVTTWEKFGDFQPRTEPCRAGERIAIYMELENPSIRQIAKGYNVQTSISYEIRDGAASVVAKKDNIVAEETTPSQKHDYCIGLTVPLSENLPAGRYQLRINVTDMNDPTMQYAEEQIPFRIAQVE